MTATTLTRAGADGNVPGLWSELHRATAAAARKHGPEFIAHRSQPDHTRLAILAEEIGEAAKAILVDFDDLRDELIDVAVCAIAWGQILHWRDLQCVMEVHTLRYGDHAVDSPHMPHGLRLAHLLEAAGRVGLAVTYSTIGSPEVWDFVLRAALLDIAAIACSWIEAHDAEQSLR